MADIQYWDDVLTNEIEDIQASMDDIPAITDVEDKLSALREVDKKIKGANGTKKSLKMETRLVTDVKQRRQYEQRLHRLDEDLKHLQADLAALKQDAERQSLFGGGGDGGGDSGEEYSDGFGKEENAVKAGDDMLAAAHNTQEQTQESLDYTKQLVAESKEVGMSTLEELKRQRETLTRIDQETDRIDSALDRAEKLIKHFSKRMASDKFIQCFTVVNVLLLVGVVVYSIFKDGGLGDKGSGAPENPVRMLRAAAVEVSANMLRGGSNNEIEP
eukprot:CAMPEP_0194028590 /NCGR_PEP_ID=MMETSP0009_2-20130614/2519_1 /TAXON_ID=210454 /ORGANISM="Grammatophora oceanica, Strain CCMP 410" /LENGTH=272 /DNA_ID=CAMNT_0038668025 /DNA_START=55 /DNA_END=873 /DNA_ORIENTATION=+